MNHVICLVCGLKMSVKGQVKFYELPPNKSKQRVWLTNINRRDLINQTISRDLRICERHFMPHMINQTTRRLKYTAIPIPVQIENSILTNQENANVSILGTSNIAAIPSQVTIVTNKECTNQWNANTSQNQIPVSRLQIAVPVVHTNNNNNSSGEGTSQLATAVGTVKMLKEEVTRLKHQVKYYQGKDYFMQQCRNFFSPTFASIVESQWRNVSHDRNGYRYSPEMKKFCLDLYNISPSGYAFLSKSITLPIGKTLCRYNKKSPPVPDEEKSMPNEN